jgi:hypothetical protein
MGIDGLLRVPRSKIKSSGEHGRNEKDLARAQVQNASIGWILIYSMNTLIFQKWPQFRESSKRVIAVIAFKSPTFVYLWREITTMQ